MARVAAGLLVLLLGSRAEGQMLELHLPAQVDDPRTPAVMQDLAARIIPIYQDSDRRRYFATLSRLQEVAGSWSAAYAATLSLAELSHRPPGEVARTPEIVYQLHVRAKALQAQERRSYREELARAYDTLVGPLDNGSAYRVSQWLRASPAPAEQMLQRDFERQRQRERIGLADAIELVEAYAQVDAQRSIAPVVGDLVAADESRRYVMDQLSIPTGTGASMATVLVRPRTSQTLPTLLTLTLEADPGMNPREEAIGCAAHGYVGMVALASAKSRRTHASSSDPYDYDGEDARAVIRWIAAQGFSDGRVALLGHRFGAFMAWTVARKAPAALRAMVVTGAIAPGIDLPMEGGIFRSEAYRWLVSVSPPKEGCPGCKEETPEEGRWRSTLEKWYRSGAPFRDLDRLYGIPSPVFQRWLRHPTLDAFWRSRLPRPRELAQLAVPVLSLSGYYDAEEAGTLYYFRQHHRARAHAEHLLLLGPYDEEALRTGAQGAYPMDPAARIDLGELRFQWLDHVLRGTPRPPVLASTINYEVMGADAWRHVTQLPGTPARLRLYLAPGEGGARLQQQKPAGQAYVEQTVDLASREGAVPLGDAPILSRTLQAHDAVLFVSEPLKEPVELAGHLQLQLRVSVSRRDVDLTVSLYEQLADGQYLLLHSPPFEQRASHAADPSTSHLLTPDRVQSLTLTSSRVLARRTAPGSRLVLLLGVKKRADEEINYGTGGVVSRESRADARHPLRLRWYAGSYLEIPQGP